MFPSEDGGLLDESSFRRRIFKPLLVAAKLRHLRIHDLRHTFASLLLADGADLKYVQQQLGHHSPAFTLAHLQPSGRHGFVNRRDTVAPGGTLRHGVG